MKKNCAPRPVHRWVGLMSNLNQPMVRKIARPHCFVTVIVRRIRWIDDDVAIVIWRPWIIAPDVGFGDLMIWIFAAGGQFGVVSKNFADGKNSCGRATVACLLVHAWFTLTG